MDRYAKTGRYPKAIVPVALYGMPYRIDRIMAVADKYGIPAYLNGVSEAVFKVGMCLPAGPWVSDEDVRYIVECIKEAVV